MADRGSNVAADTAGSSFDEMLAYARDAAWQAPAARESEPAAAGRG